MLRDSINGLDERGDDQGFGYKSDYGDYLFTVVFSVCFGMARQEVVGEEKGVNDFLYTSAHQAPQPARMEEGTYRRKKQISPSIKLLLSKS